MSICVFGCVLENRGHRDLQYCAELAPLLSPPLQKGVDDWVWSRLPMYQQRYSACLHGV